MMAWKRPAVGNFRSWRVVALSERTFSRITDALQTASSAFWHRIYKNNTRITFYPSVLSSPDSASAPRTSSDAASASHNLLQPPHAPSTCVPSMAKDNEQPSSNEKGKGKVDDVREVSNGDKRANEIKEKATGHEKEAGGKAVVEGKKDEEVQNDGMVHSSQMELKCESWLRMTDMGTEELSEEDLQLKNELEMLVERLKVGRKLYLGLPIP